MSFRDPRGSSLDAALDRLRLRKRSYVKEAAYKTVDTFAGITQRKLWLRDGERARTDGHAIIAPFKDKHFYRKVEHEISHILFKSDAIARKKFVEEYGSRVDQVVRKAGREFDKARFNAMVLHIIGILEDHRCTTLWALLYPGSAAEIAEMDLELVTAMAPKAVQSLLVYIACVSVGIDVDVDRFNRFKPFIEEAFRKVERRGFGATLLVSKWLITQLVSELIRQKLDEPPIPCPVAMAIAIPMGGGQPQSGQGSKQDDQDGESDADDQEAQQDDQNGSQGSSGGSQEGDQDDSQEGSEEASGGSEGQEQGDQKGDEPKPGEWYPPPVQGDQSQRSDALDQLMQDATLGDKLDELYGDFEDYKFLSKVDVDNAEALAAQLTKLNVNDPAKMGAYLGLTREEMEQIAEDARNAIKQQMLEDDWLRKDAMAKVVFTDVKQPEGVEPPPMEEDDQETIRRLRSQFYRVMGRRKSALAESGSEIDVQAFLQYMVSNVPGPVFKHEERGRGFGYLLFLDRSGSMWGDKTEQVERAARIIKKALKFPFVEGDVWGFKSTENGQVDIDRFAPNQEVFSTQRSTVGGVTPLHVAARLGVRYLMSKGSMAKHLFLLTDGFPVYENRKGQSFPTWQLMGFTRDEVIKGRRKGVGVTGIMIGDKHHDGSMDFDLTPKQMKFVFGPQKCWRRMDPDRIGHDLVRLVASSFTEFLKGT